MAAPVDGTWTPNGWSETDAVDWDALGSVAIQTVEEIGVVVHDSGLGALVSFMVGAVVTIAVVKMVLGKLGG